MLYAVQQPIYLKLSDNYVIYEHINIYFEKLEWNRFNFVFWRV